MATEKQIAANRANARLSTGPRTIAGKQRASRNAYRHGLCTPLPAGPLNAARTDTLVEAILAQHDPGDHAGAANAGAARQFAQAQLELLRVRGVQTEMLATTDIASAEALHRLLAIDRYETLALRRRRRALRDL